MPTHHRSFGSESKKVKPIFKGDAGPNLSKGLQTLRGQQALALEGQLGK